MIGPTYHIKFLMHLQLCGMLQLNYWMGLIDAWAPWQKYWSPPPRIDGLVIVVDVTELYGTSVILILKVLFCR